MHTKMPLTWKERWEWLGDHLRSLRPHLLVVDTMEDFRKTKELDAYGEQKTGFSDFWRFLEKVGYDKCTVTKL